MRERARRGRPTKEEGGVAASPPASYVATTVYPAVLSWRVRCGVRLNFGNEFSLHRFTLRTRVSTPYPALQLTSLMSGIGLPNHV